MSLHLPITGIINNAAYSTTAKLIDAEAGQNYHRDWIWDVASGFGDGSKLVFARLFEVVGA